MEDGVSFELMTATFAADDFRLRLDWEERQARLAVHKVLEDVDPTSFLTAVTLLSSYQRSLCPGGGAVSCKRKDVLKLALDDYKRNADAIEEGFVKSARFLAREKVFDTRTLPYSTQLVPLSAICAVLGNRFEADPVRDKLARWYWCGVFGELYGGANETRFAFDLREVIGWIEGGDEPRTIRDSSFSPIRLLSLQSRLSAAYKGLSAILMQLGSRDFSSGDAVELTSYFDLAIDIHHIFPRAHCEKIGLKKAQWNSVVNKAPLAARTNRVIGGNAPSTYLATLERSHGMDPAKLDSILKSHGIIPELLRRDDFPAFLCGRASILLDLIQDATGKKISGRDSEEVVSAFGGALNRGARS